MRVYTDDRGYNQVWAASEATRVRAERRCDYMISRMGLTAGCKILEIGCGLGSNAFMIAGKPAETFWAPTCVYRSSSKHERNSLFRICATKCTTLIARTHSKLRPLIALWAMGSSTIFI